MTFKPVLILAFSLFSFCVGVPECGPDQCRDLWSAKKCDKVKYCIEEEWSKIEPTGNRDDVCEICLQMVKEARDTLRGNLTREEIKEVLEGSCALLGFKPAVKVCNKVVDKLAQELVDTLSSQMDPEAVCSVARLCNNEAFWNLHKNSKECAHCEAFTEIADKQMESISLEQFRNGILRICRTAGSFSDACSLFGTEFSDVLHSSVKTLLGSKPCEAVSLCPTRTKGEQLESQWRSRVKTQMCPLCKTVMGSVRAKLLTARTAEEFAEKISKTCEKFKFSTNTCSSLSSPAFYEKLKSSEVLSNLVCSLTYCVEKPEEDVPVWPLFPSHSGSFKAGDDFDVLELIENVEMFFPVVEEEASKPPRPVISFGDPVENPIFFTPGLYVDNKEDCKTCTDVVDVLLGSNDKDLESVCNKVQNAERCREFIAKFSPVLRSAMAEGGLSRKICDLIPSCEIKQENQPAEASPESCSFCLNVMKVLKNGDSYFWGRALEDKCNDLHGNSEDKCKNLSSLFVSFPSLFKNSTTEIEACSFLKLCEPSSVESHKSDAPAVKSACQDCMLAVQTFTDSLKSNQSSELIEKLLDSMCNLLPGEKRSKCEDLVKVIGVEGLKKIIESFTPDEVCSKVHLCRRNTNQMEISDESVELQTSGRAIPCKFCEMALKMLIDELQDNKTEEAIRNALDNLCNHFPEETVDTCKNLINEYTEDIIDMIIADFNPTEICVHLKICPVHQIVPLNNDIASFDIETNEIRDLVEPVVEEFRPRIGIVRLEEPKEADFRRFREAVQECALCEAVVGVVAKHKRMLSKTYDFPSNARFICSIVPVDKRNACISMTVSYGPSIVNLIVDHKVDPNDVCVRLDLCDPQMQAKVNQPVSVSEDEVMSKESSDCLLGPVFWCANVENAKKCGTYLHCQELVWKNGNTRTNQH